MVAGVVWGHPTQLTRAAAVTTDTTATVASAQVYAGSQGGSAPDVYVQGRVRRATPSGDMRGVQGATPASYLTRNAFESSPLGRQAHGNLSDAFESPGWISYSGSVSKFERLQTQVFKTYWHNTHKLS